MAPTLLSTATAVITADMLEPVVEGITSNITVVLPVGMTIMGIMLAVKVVPRIIHMFF